MPIPGAMARKEYSGSPPARAPSPLRVFRRWRRAAAHPEGGPLPCNAAPTAGLASAQSKPAGGRSRVQVENRSFGVVRADCPSRRGSRAFTRAVINANGVGPRHRADDRAGMIGRLIQVRAAPRTIATAPPLRQRAFGRGRASRYPQPAIGRVGILAEAVRFELTNGCPLPVFKTGAIDHSATLPGNQDRQGRSNRPWRRRPAHGSFK